MSFVAPSRPIFETSLRSPGVTFDNGKTRLNFPYHDYVEACWPYLEPDIVTVKIDKTVVVLRGHNLELLFRALESQSLKSVKAQPELALDPMQQANSYVTEITFLPSLPGPGAKSPKRGASKGHFYLNPHGWEA